MQVGEYLWLVLNRPPSITYYPDADYPDTVSPGNHPGVLERICTQGTSTTTEGLFRARKVGVAQVAFQPRPNRGPMMGFVAEVTVLPVGRSNPPAT